ncbi:MAG TPA: hypothetical protein VNP92_11980 [Actinophytocola sp.]|nr:hypothetical protein [Actinophytocola sp.]
MSSDLSPSGVDVAVDEYGYCRPYFQQMVMHAGVVTAYRPT